MTQKRIERHNDGKRVKLHPATDEWMQGDRYGEIVRTMQVSRALLDPRASERTIVTVKLDSGRTRRFDSTNILELYS